jgi:hypothetical protein
MRVLLTSEAKGLIAGSAKDPAVFIHRGGCACSGARVFAEYGSKTSVDPSILELSFEEIGEVEGISVLMNDRLKNYLEHIRVHTLTVDADRSLARLTVALSL